MTKEQIKNIIESYCEGMFWLEFYYANLDKMADEILALQSLQLQKSDAIKSVCDECNGSGLWKEDEADREQICPKCKGAKTVL